jgi:hypothetical protein
MLILNITSKVAHAIVPEWKEWTQTVWMSRMMGTGLFSDCRFCKLHDNDDEEGLMFVLQLTCDAKENYDTFLKEHDDAIRLEAYAQFGDAFISFRTVMEVLR